MEGKTWTYAYDQGGNLLERRTYTHTIAAPDGMTPLSIDTYAYTDSNWKDKLTAYNGQTITYDAIGNPLNDGVWLYQWQHGRKLVQMSDGVRTIQYTYNHNGLRVKKTVNGVETHYTLRGRQIVHLKKGDLQMHFYYDGQGRPGLMTYNGSDYYYLYNLQGDVVGLVGPSNQLVVEYRYDPWGKPLACTGSMAATLGVDNPFRYRGYVFDEETGLYALPARFYNPEWRRFINADGVIGQIGTLLSHNLFAYSQNNPIMFSDPTGRSLVSALKSIVDVVKKAAQQVAQFIKRIIANATSLNSVAPEGLRLLGEDLEYRMEGYTDGGICCAYTMYEGRGQQGHKGATLIYENDLSSKGKFSSLNDLEPGMLIFQDTGKYEIRIDKDGNEYKRYLKDHVGMVVMWDFGDGQGMQKAVFHSISVELLPGGSKLALFYNDTGPNVTTIGDDWNYYGVLK